MVMMKVVTVIKVVPPPPGQRQHRSPAGASRSQSVLSSPPRSEGWSRTVTHTRNTHTSLSCFIVKYAIVFGVCSCVVSLPVVVHHATYCCIGVILQDVSCAGVFTFLLSIHSSPQIFNLFDVSRMLCCTVSCGFLLFQVRSCRCVCSLLGSRPLTLSEQLTLAPFCRSSFTMSACPRPAAQMIGYTLYCCEGHRRTCQHHH